MIRNQDLNKSKQKLLFFLTVLLMCIYLLWRALFTIPLHSGVLSFILGVLLLYSEGITAFTTFELFYRRIKGSKIELQIPVLTDEMYPHIDVFIATHNEPIDLLFKTVNACTYMDYPDKNKVHIYLSDDTNRAEVAALAREFGVGYIGMTENKHAKSGNLNHALSKTNSPLIATFDADMIPKSTFLMKTVPYFYLPMLKKNEHGKWIEREKEEIDDNYKIGFIQTPQSFYNPDLFQFNLYGERTIPNEQDFFSKEINVMRNSSNAVAYTGSNTVISRKALEDIGGFPTNTITEDFQVGLMIQSKGYTTYSTEEPQAAGLSATTIQSMLSQRIRWGRGVIQSVKNTNVLFNKGLTWDAKISYTVCYLYWWSFFNRLIFILSPILFALFDIMIVDCAFWDLLLFWLPSYSLYSISMRYLSSDLRNQRWCQIIDTILAPYLIIPVLLETVGIKEKKFKVTSKNKEAQSFGANFKYAIPHLILVVLSVAAIIRFTNGKYGWALLYSSVIIFWLLNNLITLIYAAFFISGRKSYRQAERFDAQEDVEVLYNNKLIYGKTVNVSEGGLAFALEYPEYIPDQAPVTFRVKTNKYIAQFEGSIVYVKEVDSKWQYSVKITSINHENFCSYLQIVHDRDHSLPKQMDLWVTAADDITRNAKVRLEKQKVDKRTLPRIQMNKQIEFEGGYKGRIRDFNYQYMRIEGLGANINTLCYYSDKFQLKIKLKLIGEKSHVDSDSRLYKVINYASIIKNKHLPRLVNDWMDTTPIDQKDNVETEVVLAGGVEAC